MIPFKTIRPGGFFLFHGEPCVRTTGGDGWNENHNAFNMLMGELVCLDNDWDVKKMSYANIVRRFFPEILKRCAR